MGGMKETVYPLIEPQVSGGEFLDSACAFYEQHQINTRPALPELMELPWNPRFHVEEPVSLTAALNNHQEQQEVSYQENTYQDVDLNRFHPMEEKNMVGQVQASQQLFITQQEEEQRQQHSWRLPAFSRLVNPQYNEAGTSTETAPMYCHTETGEIGPMFAEVNRGFNGDSATQMLEKNSEQPFLGMLFSSVDSMQQPRPDRGSNEEHYSSTDMSLLQQFSPMDPAMQLPFLKKAQEMEEEDMAQTEFQQHIAYNLTSLNYQQTSAFYATSQPQHTQPVEGQCSVNAAAPQWMMMANSSQHEDTKPWFSLTTPGSWKSVETG